jgi:hypothetical protein
MKRSQVLKAEWILFLLLKKKGKKKGKKKLVKFLVKTLVE